MVSEHAARNTSARVASPVLQAALEQLQVASVTQAARSLGVSERQLRRILHEALGIGPKTFSRLMRFEHAVRAAQAAREINWSNIAVDAGYYDQAHLIADFHAIAGNTPRMLMAELMHNYTGDRRGNGVRDNSDRLHWHQELSLTPFRRGQELSLTPFPRDR